MIIRERKFKSFDGTEIAYQTVGRGKPIVMANGLGGNIQAWKHLLDYFRKDYKFITWDYRGLYNSQPPGDLKTLTIEDQCRDLEVLLAREKVEKAIFMGWSMGVQINLEFYKRQPDRFLAMIIINGTYGLPFETAFSSRISHHLIPYLIGFVQNHIRFSQRALRWGVRRLNIIRIIKKLGIVCKTLDEEIFATLAQDFAQIDLFLYMESFKALGRHNAEGVLKDIEVPTLVIAGDRDLFTPLTVSEKIHRDIRGSELMIVPSGSHYTPIEFPELINLRIEKFLRDKSL